MDGRWLAKSEEKVGEGLFSCWLNVSLAAVKNYTSAMSLTHPETETLLN